jgi:predicted transcriptional regulator of viral defense system
MPGADQIVANLMYRPSYISLYSALAHYGMIPEFVARTTSVTTLKTASFCNEMGAFDYRHLKPDLFWGYHMIDSVNQRKILIALPEKALLDLLYLTPSLKGEDDMLQLRLDEDYMTSDFDLDQARQYLERFNSHALNYRFNLLQKVYLND